MKSGLLSQSTGEITVNGLPPGQSQDIGYVFQEATLMPWATVFDNVYLPLRLKGISRPDAQVDVEAALASVGLSGLPTDCCCWAEVVTSLANP